MNIRYFYGKNLTDFIQNYWIKHRALDKKLSKPVDARVGTV